MSIDCPNHYQGRVSISIGGNLVHRSIYVPPIRHRRRVFQPSWRSQVRWEWGSKYKNQTGYWVLDCPVSLRVESRNGAPYIYAIDSLGRYRSGQYLDPRGRSLPKYQPGERPPSPILLGYVASPPPAIHYLDLYSGDTTGSGGNLEGTWQQSGNPPDIQVDCSCNTQTEVQCGDMRSNPEEDTWCCISCSNVNSAFNGWAAELENMTDRLTS